MEAKITISKATNGLIFNIERGEVCKQNKTFVYTQEEQGESFMHMIYRAIGEQVGLLVGEKMRGKETITMTLDVQ